MPRHGSELFIPRPKWRIQHFGQREISCVVGGQVFTQRPNTSRQRRMRKSRDRRGLKHRDRRRRARLIHPPKSHQPAKCLYDFQVEHLGRSHLGPGVGNERLKLCCAGSRDKHFQRQRRIDDDRRPSRSCLTISTREPGRDIGSSAFMRLTMSAQLGRFKSRSIKRSR